MIGAISISFSLNFFTILAKSLIDPYLFFIESKLNSF
ncbi:Uncharacterised protein [Chlamydia trachomatis]|nr:Uncharacterised protein [Chlamydia trachomatis]